MRALAGEALPVPPVWLMRQAGRYLPEYRATRAQAGSFLDLCYTPELAAEVTLQPIRRFGFDAAILFADILLVPHALGAELTLRRGRGAAALDGDDGRTIWRGCGRRRRCTRRWRRSTRRCGWCGRRCRAEVPLIGFAGAPWTVATYMVAGRGTPDQAPARALIYRDAGDLRRADRADHRGDDRLPAGAGRGRGRGRQAVRFVGRVAARAAVRALRGRAGAADRRGGAGGASGGAGDRLSARGGRRLCRLRRARPGCRRWRSTPRSIRPGRRAALPAGMCLQGNLDPLLMVVGGEPLAAAARRDGRGLRRAAARLQPRARDHAGRDAGERRDAAAGDPGG